MNSTQELTLSGRSLIGRQLGDTGGTSFHGVNPSNRERLEPEFRSASAEDIDNAANLAADAFRLVQGLSGRKRAAFLSLPPSGLSIPPFGATIEYENYGNDTGPRPQRRHPAAEA